MDKKKLLQVFLGSWAVLIFLLYLTGGGDGMSPVLQVAGTGVLAALIALLAWVALRGERGQKNLTLCAPGGAEVLYRVEGMWIYRGWEEKASWYLKRNAVYGFASMTPLYRVKDGGLYREGEEQPFLKVERDRVTSCADGSVVYEIR